MQQIIWKCHTNQTTDSTDEFQRAEMLMYVRKKNEKENAYLCRHSEINTCAISKHLSRLQRALLYCASSLENINLHSTGQHTDTLTAPFPRRVPQFSSQMALVPPSLLHMEVLQFPRKWAHKCTTKCTRGKLSAYLFLTARKPEIISKPSPGDEIHIHLHLPAAAGDVMDNSKTKSHCETQKKPKYPTQRDELTPFFLREG